MFTRSKGKTDFVIKYKLPFTVKRGDEYKMMIQKQPGNDGWEYKLDLFGHKQDPFILKQDQEIKVKI